MSYRDRPVFETPPNWRQLPRKEFRFDLKEQSLGFNEEYFASLQQSVVQGWEVLLDLRSDEEINAFEDFMAALNGRLAGFWFSSPIDSMEISAAISTTQFDIAGQKLSATWNQRVDLHLYFQCDGFAPAAAKITAVIDNGDGTERVTIDTALDLLDPLNYQLSTNVSRLLYVALASDDLEGEFLGDSRLAQPLRVVELPTEYAGFELGEKKIYLYEFWCNAPMDIRWRYTNFAADVVSQNQLFSKFQMEHGTITRSLRLDEQPIEVPARRDANHPYALFNGSFSRPLFIKIYELDYSDPDTRKVLFTGRVLSVQDKGEQLSGNCASFVYLLSRKLPGPLIGKSCPWHVYDVNCKALRARFETSAMIVQIGVDAGTQVPYIRVELNFPTAEQFPKWISSDWFKDGWIETGYALGFEVRSVLSSVHWSDNIVQLNLNAPLVRAVADGSQVIYLVPGCGGDFDADCDAKFDNAINHGGFKESPKDNLSLSLTNTSTSQGGKGK